MESGAIVTVDLYQAGSTYRSIQTRPQLIQNPSGTIKNTISPFKPEFQIGRTNSLTSPLVIFLFPISLYHSPAMPHATLLPDWPQLRPFLPEIWLTGGILAALLVPFFTRQANRICGIAAAVAVVLGLISLLSMQATPGPWFAGLLTADPLSRLWSGLLLLFVLGIIAIWFSAVAPQMHDGDGPEFFTLLLGATLGLMLMGTTSNLLMIALAVELASLPSYILAGFRKTSRLGAEAALKYVLFGAAATSVMIYGLSILYGAGGGLQFEEIVHRISFSGANGALAMVGLLALFVGIAFKICAVPFHFWCPDVFEGASVDVSAFLSVASKGAGLVLLLRLLTILVHASPPAGVMTAMAIVLGVIAAATMTVGNTGALIQTNIKRLLAYSSIAQAGYMLCVLAILPTGKSFGGDAATTAASSILLVYLAVYLFMNLGAFAVAALIERHIGADNIIQYAGMGRRAPVLAACMALFMVSLIGLPPLGGFIAKLNVMVLVGSAGHLWWVLVGIIAVNTIISIYYYFNVVRQMYFRPSDEPAFNPIPLGAVLTITCSVVLVAMLIFFAPLTAWTARHARIDRPVPSAAVDFRAAD
jgi:NADH-quinone oxidoreductase subunit N